MFAMSPVLLADAWPVSDSLCDPESRRESCGNVCTLLLTLLALFLGVAGVEAAFPLFHLPPAMLVKHFE